MAEYKIDPNRVTRPIQLLAAWLVGLIVIDASFLTAASKIVVPPWIPSLLAIASVVNVPLFLVCMFVLQTKYRVEMQEDSFYSKYIKDQQGIVVQKAQKELAEAMNLLNASKSEFTAALQSMKLESSQVQQLTIAQSQIERATRLEVAERVLFELRKHLQVVIAHAENLVTESASATPLARETVTVKCTSMLEAALALNSALNTIKKEV